MLTLFILRLFFALLISCAFVLALKYTTYSLLSMLIDSWFIYIPDGAVICCMYIVFSVLHCHVSVFGILRTISKVFVIR